MWPIMWGYCVSRAFPKALFSDAPLRPSEYERICQEQCDTLLHQIACITKRRVIRVKPSPNEPSNGGLAGLRATAHGVPAKLATVWA